MIRLVLPSLVGILLSSVIVFSQEAISPTITYTYDAAGNRVTAISTPGNNEAKSADLILVPSSRHNVGSAVTKSRKEDVSSGDDPQRIVGDIADERKSLHQSSKKNKRDY